MSAIAWQDVLDVAIADAASLDTLTDGQKSKVVGLVMELVNPETFRGEDSTTLTMARSWLGAHFAFLMKNGNLLKGAISSRSEGGASVSYTNLLSTDPRLLALTVYGRNFLSLVEVSPVARAGFVLGQGRRCW